MRPLLLILALLHVSLLFAQRQGWKGGLRGVVYDQTHDSALKSATVAIYKAKDSALLAYRLSNTKGEFSFSGLPTGTDLKVIVSYIGFGNAQQTVTIADSIDLGRIGLIVRSGELEEVTVSAAPPPVRMKGDTLEFNADAFKLDSTAQVEDLVRILPGVTLWIADGSITVNGRMISQVLVNGKPFFGQDAKIALQNLPKNIVEKVQVYQRITGMPNKKDSTAILDIRLKRGKDAGYFGKIASGYGTSGHYQGDFSLNYFNGRNQVGAAFTSNNVNKVAGNIAFVLRNNTYKGDRGSTEYQSDFSSPGISNFTSAGVLFQHDFVDSPSYGHQNQLSGVYFFKDRQTDINTAVNQVTTVNDSTVYHNNSVNHSHSLYYGHNADLKYDKSVGSGTLTITSSLQSDISINNGAGQSTTSDKNNQRLTQQNTSNSNNGQVNTYNFEAQLFKFWDPKPKWYKISQFDYHFTLNNSTNTQKTQTSYISAVDSSQNTFIDRIYHPANKGTTQSLFVSLPNLSMLFTGSKSSPLSIGIQTSAQVSTSSNDKEVYDIDTTTKTMAVNNGLSNRQNDLAYNFDPAISIARQWSNSGPKKHPKTNRSVNVFGTLIEEFHGYKSWSIQQLQQLTRSWQNFIPSAHLIYSTSKGPRQQSMQLGYAMQFSYPVLQQLAPLVDNSNPNLIQYGNIALTPQKTNDLLLSFMHNSTRSAGAISYTINAKTSFSDSYITWSSNIDSLGRTHTMPVNAKGYRRVYLSVELKKAFHSRDPNQLQVQFTLLPEFSIDRSPRIVNQQLNLYDNYNGVLTPTMNITYKDWLTFGLSDREGWARSVQSNAGSVPLTNHTNSTTATGWIKLTRAFSVSSNITYTVNTSTAATRQAFTLWNASANYRFLRDETGEIKFSALDLLHQNTGLQNSAFDNTITHGSSNILRQYFMLTAAWHPRKFGRRHKS